MKALGLTTLKPVVSDKDEKLDLKRCRQNYFFSFLFFATFI